MSQQDFAAMNGSTPVTVSRFIICFVEDELASEGRK